MQEKGKKTDIISYPFHCFASFCILLSDGILAVAMQRDAKRCKAMKKKFITHFLRRICLSASISREKQ